ncbi:MAG: carbohydrate ABC transporter permease [Candidatus Korarchaeota archaeon]
MDVKKLLVFIGLTIYGLWVLAPYYLTIITSFKELVDVFSIPPKIVPFIDFKPTLEGYQRIFATKSGWTFITSLITATTATILALILGLLAAYGFSRFSRAPMNDERSFFILLTLRMLPPFAVVLPIVSYWVFFGLADTFFALIWTYTIFSIPLTVWLIKGFVDEIPKSIDDAARVDGYSFWRMFRRILIPLLGAGLAATTALVWLFLWNEFLFALKVAGGNVVTYTAHLPQLKLGQRTLWNVFAAMGVIGSIPPIIIFILFRRYIIRLYLR